MRPLLAIQGLTSHIKNLSKCVYRTGITMERPVLGVLATADVVTTARQKELGVCVINIGGSSTTMVVFEQGDIEVAKQTAAVASSDRKANWTWEVSYGQRTGYSDMVSVGVNIPLQVARNERQDRESASKLALVEKAEADLAEATRAALAEYLSLTSDVSRLRERIERYQSGVITPAQQRTATAMAAYRSNQVTLQVLFEARHAEVEARRKLLTLQRDLARTQAQLAFRPLTFGAAQ